MGKDTTTSQSETASQLDNEDMNTSDNVQSSDNIEETTDNATQSEETNNETMRSEIQSLTPDDIMKIVEQSQILEKENARLKDEFLRSKAETENMKKRLTRHFEEVAKENTKKLLLDIITLLDNFERAFEASLGSEGQENNDNSIIEGIKMIEDQFIQVLKGKWNVIRYDSLNVEFDPEKHEAMMREVSNEVAAPMVTMEFSKGYMVGDKILRPAKVKVTTPE